MSQGSVKLVALLEKQIERDRERWLEMIFERMTPEQLESVREQIAEEEANPTPPCVCGFFPGSRMCRIACGER